MTTAVLLVAGPPASAALWPEVSGRMRAAGLAPRAVELFHPPPEDGRVDALAERLASELRDEEGAIVVAHGTAVPIAWRAALRAPVGRLVLSNGPLRHPDPVLRAIGRLPEPTLTHLILQPRLLRRWLASSIGLRRTVVNPYVMDRDIVVALTEPWLQTARHRRAVAHFLRDLRRVPPPSERLGIPTLLCWGDADPLYPLAGAEAAAASFEDVTIEAISGGHHYHPEERPWALADTILRWLENP